MINILASGSYIQGLGNYWLLQLLPSVKNCDWRTGGDVESESEWEMIFWLVLVGCILSGQPWGIPFLVDIIQASGQCMGPAYKMNQQRKFIVNIANV